MPFRPLSFAVPAHRVWILATVGGAVAAGILFDAALGVNLVAWIALVAAGLVAMRPRDDRTWRTLALPLGFAVALAASAAVTASAAAQFVALMLAMSLLALATLISALRPSPRTYGPVFILIAPIRAFVMTVGSAVQTVGAGAGSIGVIRRHPALRGAILATPVALLFAGLFAAADPLFARGRDAVTDLFTSVDAIPRLVFFVAATLFVLGAYAYAASTGARDVAPPERPSRLPVPGTTERTIVIATAAVLSWLFVALQVVYLVGDAPARPGSGITFAQYAHRGFGELSVLATVAVLLVVGALGQREATQPPRRLCVWVLALLAAVAGVLASAFHRVALYEGVYGFTTARVHAQAYMLVVLAVLALCALETVRGFDTARLARATMTAALVGICAMSFWNDEAWVVRADVARFAGTKRLDVHYLARRLSPDAYPALLAALPALPASQRQQLASALWPRATCTLRRGTRWFEWNLRRSRARAALAAHGYPLTPAVGCPTDD
jgi:hypothetical protein